MKRIEETFDTIFSSNNKSPARQSDNYDRNELDGGTVYDQPAAAPNVVPFEKIDDPAKSHDAPPRRPRTIILGAFMIFTTLFQLISLLTPIYHYDSGSGDTAVSITIKYYSIQVCPMESYDGVTITSRCEYTSLSTHLCSAVYQRIETAGYFGIFGLVASFLIAVLCIIEYRGKVIVRSFTFRGACVVWIASMIQWILLTNVYLARLCKQTNMHEIGFKYHVGWALPLVLCLILLIPILVLYFLRKKLQGSSST